MPGPQPDNGDGGQSPRSSGNAPHALDDRPHLPQAAPMPARPRNPYLDTPGFLALGTTEPNAPPKAEGAYSPADPSHQLPSVSRPVSSLREKFNSVEPEQMKMQWLDEQWQRIRQIFNV